MANTGVVYFTIVHPVARQHKNVLEIHDDESAAILRKMHNVTNLRLHIAGQRKRLTMNKRLHNRLVNGVRLFKQVSEQVRTTGVHTNPDV